MQIYVINLKLENIENILHAALKQSQMLFSYAPILQDTITMN